ncbi:MAG: MotA/TolQ/ExbB proton channel family protein, partial [Kiritimatiellae bacterium]|nr:MotA/TolQ/ExbB proton channel family protein [Kiritimatiellia bacterium]
VYGMSFAEAWRSGGWIMWVLLAISIFAVMLVLYFLFAFREAAVAPRRQVAAVRDAILEGDDMAARRGCDDRGGAFSAVALTALGCVRATGGNPDGELLRDLVRAEGSRHVEAMQSQAQLLLDLSAIAPMVGLLGTTLGMLQAFGSIAQDVLVAAKPVILAQGVSKAIVTTIAGLLVAIPCMFAYAVFRRRVVALAGRLEAASAEVVTAIVARRELRK